MVLFIRSFGILIVALGLIFMLKENAFKNYISFWRNEKRLKIGGVVAFLFGILFLMAAPQCRMSWLIVVLGIWSIIKGGLLLMLSPKKLFAYFDWWSNKPYSSLRYFGIIAMAFGGLLVYSAS